MRLQFPFAPYLLVSFFFFVTVTIYLERLSPIKLIKQNIKQLRIIVDVHINVLIPTAMITLPMPFHKF